MLNRNILVHPSLQNLPLNSLSPHFFRTDYFSRPHNHTQYRSSTSIRKRNIRVSPLKQLPVRSYKQLPVCGRGEIGREWKRIIPKKLGQLPGIELGGKGKIDGQLKRKMMTGKNVGEMKEREKERERQKEKGKVKEEQMEEQREIEKKEEKQKEKEKSKEKTYQQQILPQQIPQIQHSSSPPTQTQNLSIYSTLLIMDQYYAQQYPYIRAFSTTLGKILILKSTPSSLTNQLQMVSLIKHPNILQHLTQIRDNKIYYYSQEMPSNLEQLMSSMNRMNVGLIRKIVRQILDVLEQLQAKNLYLVKLTPEKILLDSDGNIKLNIISSQVSTSITQSTFQQHFPSHSSILYKSPQTILSNKITIKSNIWSLGCIIYKMITRGTPAMFDGKGMKGTGEFVEWMRGMGGGGKEIELPNVTKGLKDFVGRCLEGEEGKRARVGELRGMGFVEG